MSATLRRRSVRTLLLPCLIAILLPTALSAQQHASDRGSWILGGNAGFVSQTHTYESGGVQEEASFTVLHFGPLVQHFIAPGLAVGGALDLTRSSFQNQSSTRYGGGPIVSYLFQPATERALVPYVSGQATLSNIHGVDTNMASYSAAGGALYMLSSSVGVDVSVFGRWERPTGEEFAGGDSRAIGVAVGFSAFTF